MYYVRQNEKYCSMLSESWNSGVRSEVDFLDNSVHS
jgi:hypothetical protein